MTKRTFGHRGCKVTLFVEVVEYPDRPPRNVLRGPCSVTNAAGREIAVTISPKAAWAVCDLVSEDRDWLRNHPAWQALKALPVAKLTEAQRTDMEIGLTDIRAGRHVGGKP